MTTEFSILPDPISGYPLEQHTGGMFSIVVPTRDDVINLITNPSIEIATTGFTAIGGAIAQSSNEQARGVYSLRIAPTAGVNDGVYFTTSALVAATKHGFSLDVLADKGSPLEIQARDNAGGTIYASKKFVASGRWQREELIFTSGAAAAHRLYLIKDGSASAAYIYTDGWQLETGNPTTYLDGDMRGFVPNRKDYYWLGARGLSASVRIGHCRGGGVEMKLKELQFILLGIVGLGMGGLRNYLDPLARGGAIFNGTIVEDRVFSLVGAIYGNNLNDVHKKRGVIEEYLSHDYVYPVQPVTLKYRPQDCDGIAGQTLEIPCVFNSGLEGSWDNVSQERVSLGFRVFMPYVAKHEYSVGAILDIRDSLGAATVLSYREPDGTWTQLSTTGVIVRHGAFGPDGALYLVGDLNIGGVAAADGIARYENGTFTALANGFTFGVGGYAQRVCFDQAGNLYATGQFTQASGVANTARIAMWDGAAWNAMGTGIGTGIGYALACDKNGNIYVGGTFTGVGGVASTARIARWNGIAWSSIGVASGTVIYSIVASGNYIYAGGDFTTIGAATGNGIARYNITTGVWEDMGAGINVAGGEVIYTVYVAKNGMVYAAGRFTNMDGVACNNIAVWNGTYWSPLQSGYDVSATGFLTAEAEDEVGNIYISGYQVGEQYLPGVYREDTLIWNGSALLNYSAGNERFFTNPYTDRPYLIGGPGHDVPGIVEVENPGSETGEITFEIEGPGKILQIFNFTTKQYIWTNYEMAAGERVILSLKDSGNAAMISSIAGDILGSVLPGSDLTLSLRPGKNYIGLFIQDRTADSGATIAFYPVVRSLAEAIE